MSRKVVTVEQTSKSIKANMLVSAVLAIWSLVHFFSYPSSPVYAWTFVFGVVWHVGSRVWRWWKHG